jgi:hypothetical protein
LYSRLFLTKAPGLDDVLVVIAHVFGIALAVLVIIGDKVYDINRHVWDIPISKASGSRLNEWCSQWCYVTASCCVKISILLFYRRLSVTFSKAFLIGTWVGIVFNLLYLVGFLLQLVIQCRPISAYWLAFDPAWLAAGHTYSCPGNEHISLPLSGIFSVIGDFYSTMLPLLLVYFLDLPTRQKRALYALFGLGFLVVAAGIIRTILLNHLINQTYDFSWTLWETWIWSIIELHVAIFAASAPALKPFLRKCFKEPLSSRSPGSERGRAFDLGIGKGRSNNLQLDDRNLKAGGSAGAVAAWDQDDTSVRFGHAAHDLDLEKIGVAISHEKGCPKDEDLEMKGEVYHLQHRSRWDHEEIGAAFPVRHVRGQRSPDFQSDLGRTTSQSHSDNGQRNQDWMLPQTRVEDTSNPRQNPAAIEKLPPLYSHKQMSGGFGVARDASLDAGQQRPRKRPSTEMSGSTAVGGTVQQISGYMSQHQQSIGGTSQSGPEKDLSQGSTKSTQAQIRVAKAREASRFGGFDDSLPTPRIGQTQHPVEPEIEETRTRSRLRLDSDSEDDDNFKGMTNISGDRRTWNTNTYRDDSEAASVDENFEEKGKSDGSSDTLHLPRQGSRDDFHGGAGERTGGLPRVGMAI